MGGWVTTHRLRSILQTLYKNTTWEIQLKEFTDKLMCFKKPLKSDSGKKSEKLNSQHKISKTVKR